MTVNQNINGFVCFGWCFDLRVDVVCVMFELWLCVMMRIIVFC